MLWNGFELREFEFEGKEAKVVIPQIRAKHPRLAIKTEYWDAFPKTEIELLKEGFYLCYIKNNNRWGTDEDLDRKARFVKKVIADFGLSEKCVPVGMSCGGLFAIKFAAKYPELVSCIYVDAPVLNFMSCPCGFGVGNPLSENLDEILDALNISLSELLCYREMPMDKLPALIENKIPAIMVAGDSDSVVPYVENGILLEKAYKENNVPIEVYIKPGCDHHPHGLEDTTPVIEFIKKYA